MTASEEIHDDETRRAVLLALRYVAQAQLAAPGARDPRVVDEIDADELWPDAFVAMALIAAELLSVAASTTNTSEAESLRKIGNMLIGADAHAAVPDPVPGAPGHCALARDHRLSLSTGRVAGAADSRTTGSTPSSGEHPIPPATSQSRD